MRDLWLILFAGLALVSLVSLALADGMARSRPASMLSRWHVAPVASHMACSSTAGLVVHPNTGATDTVTLTLPASAREGVGMTVVSVNAHAIDVTPQSGDHVEYSGGTMADSQALRVGSRARLELVYDGAGAWIATTEGGTLTEQ